MRKGASLTGIGNYNEKVVLHAIRLARGISQTELVERTGLATQTVSAIVNQLLAKGQVRASGVQPVGRGRPRTILEIVPESRFALGIHLDPAQVTAVILNLAGSVVSIGHAPAVPDEGPEASLPSIVALVERVVGDSGVEQGGILGACLATPGVVDPVKGCMVRPLWLPTWDQFPIRDRLAAELGVGVDFIKDTLAAVTGETWIRAETADDASLVFVYLGIGIGVGVAINGEALTGASGNSGEIGRLQIAIGSAEKLGEAPGRGLDNDPAILVQRAIRSGVMPGDESTTQTVAGIDASFHRLCALAGSGEGRGGAIRDGAGRRLGAAAAVISEIVDADEVVFGGPYWHLVREFYEPEAVQAMGVLLPDGPHRVRVTSTSMGTDVGAIGAAARVLDGRYVPRTGIMR